MAEANVFNMSLRDAPQRLETVNKELGILGEKAGSAALRATFNAVRGSLTMREASAGGPGKRPRSLTASV